MVEHLTLTELFTVTNSGCYVLIYVTFS